GARGEADGDSHVAVGTERATHGRAEDIREAHARVAGEDGAEPLGHRLHRWHCSGPGLGRATPACLWGGAVDGEDDGDRSRSATRTRAAFARSFQSLHLCMSSRMWGTSQRSSGSTPLPLPENVLPELELRAK